MSNIKKSFFGVAATFLCGVTQAAILNFDYVASASNAFQAVSGDFGTNVNIGDTVSLTLKTQAGQQFSTNNNYIWAIVGFESAGTRVADYTWSFFNDGVIVGAGAATQSTGSIHMGPYITTGFAGYFDEYVWTGVLTSSSTGDDNIAADIMFNSPPLPGYGGTWSYGDTSASLVPDNTVPEPTSIALMGLGLAGLGFSRRKAKKQ